MVAVVVVVVVIKDQYGVLKGCSGGSNNIYSSVRGGDGRAKTTRARTGSNAELPPARRLILRVRLGVRAMRERGEDDYLAEVVVGRDTRRRQQWT